MTLEARECIISNRVLTSKETQSAVLAYLFEELQLNCILEKRFHGTRTMIQKGFFTKCYWLSLKMQENTITVIALFDFNKTFWIRYPAALAFNLVQMLLLSILRIWAFQCGFRCAIISKSN